MNNDSKTLRKCVVIAACIMSLSACNNYGLKDKLEVPGSNSSGGGGGSTGGSGSAIPTLYLFSTSTTTDGNLKGSFSTARQGADNKCITARSGITFPDNTCNQIRAIVSLSGSDSISNMPGNYSIPTNKPIHTPGGPVFAADWNVFIAGTSGNKLENGVMPSGVAWWSFSNGDGSYAMHNCLGGENSVSGNNGMTSTSSVTGAGWISGTANTCNNTYRLLCICY